MGNSFFLLAQFHPRIKRSKCFSLLFLFNVKQAIKIMLDKVRYSINKATLLDRFALIIQNRDFCAVCVFDKDLLSVGVCSLFVLDTIGGLRKCLRY